jgi:hypothetical protein
MHALIEFQAATLFSFRSITANAFAARTLPCPTPAGIKMALLAGLVGRDGAERGQEHLDWLAPLGVAWRPPARLVITAATVRVWKADAADKPLMMQAGMREYVHLGGPFGLALLDVPEARHEDLAWAAARLRALGNAESLVQPLAPPAWRADLPPGYVLLTADAESGGAGEVTVVLDDLGPRPSFARLSVYRPAGRDTLPRLGDDRVRRLVTLPLRAGRWSADGVVLEALA